MGGVFLEEASRVRQRKRDIWVGTWNVRSLYRAGSLTVAARELARCQVFTPCKISINSIEDLWWLNGKPISGSVMNQSG